MCMYSPFTVERIKEKKMKRSVNLSYAATVDCRPSAYLVHFV